MDKKSWEEGLARYDKLIEKCSKFKRKGKTMPYTAANGYMFTLFNKAGEIGIRFAKERQQQLIEEHQTTIYKSYGAVMKGYVLITEKMLEDLDAVAEYANESYDYVMSLEPK